MKKNFFKSYEFFLILLLATIWVIVGLVNPKFFSLGTLFDVFRAQTVYIMMAFGLLPVVILGGVDISFVAIGALATYPVHYYLLNHGYAGGMGLYFVIAIVIGLLAGLLIGFLNYRFKLSIFDLSLGVNTMIYGAVLFFVDAVWNFDMSTGLDGWNQKALITVKSSGLGGSFLHISFLVVLVTGVLLHLFLTYTTLGRSIYAMGSNRSVAIRTGINPKLIFLTVFPIMGLMAALAGITWSGLEQQFRPVLFQGKNMQVLAAVIMGGASIRGGKGSVLGVFLGTILVGIISQALVYMKIPTAWMDTVMGITFISFAVYQTLETRTTK
ncbi:MAG: ABC transporter permease [Pelolinea sp.]|nr:ABC transporter permease [Pelolinea sp.]